MGSDHLPAIEMIQIKVQAGNGALRLLGTIEKEAAKKGIHKSALKSSETGWLAGRAIDTLPQGPSAGGAYDGQDRLSLRTPH